MPASFMKKTMAYLGLVDDDYDDYDDYDSRSPLPGRVSTGLPSPTRSTNLRRRRNRAPDPDR